MLIIMTWAFSCDDLSAHREKAEIPVIQTKQNNSMEISLTYSESFLYKLF